MKKKTLSVFALGIAVASAASAQLLGIGVGAGVAADVGVGVSGAVRGATHVIQQTTVDVDASVRSRAAAPSRVYVESAADAEVRSDVRPAPRTHRAPAPVERHGYEERGRAGIGAAAQSRVDAEVHVPRVEVDVQSDTRVRGGALVR